MAKKQPQSTTEHEPVVQQTNEINNSQPEETPLQKLIQEFFEKAKEIKGEDESLIVIGGQDLGKTFSSGFAIIGNIKLLTSTLLQLLQNREFSNFTMPAIINSLIEQENNQLNIPESPQGLKN